MNEQQFNRPLPPQEKVANMYDALLGDDQFWADVEVDPTTCDQATRIMRNAIERTLGPDQAAAFGDRPNFAGDRIFDEAPAETKSPKGWARLGWRTWAQKIGLHPFVAFIATLMALAVDVTTWGTLGVGTVLDIPIAPLLGTTTFLMQEKLYGDSRRAALLKALIVVVLTVLPIPLAPFVFIPAGIIGLFHRKTASRAHSESRENRTTKIG